jgi:hypothetical protein
LNLVAVVQYNVKLEVVLAWEGAQGRSWSLTHLFCLI